MTDRGSPQPLFPGVSVVVPVYNSQATLGLLAERLADVFRSLQTPLEIVLVDDGSSDSSWDCVRELAAAYAFVRGLRMMRNYGQHNALLCGIRAARHAIVVTIDDDLQNPPEEIPRLLAALGSDFDVVYGRPEQEQHGFLRDLASYITKMVLQHSMGVQAARGVSAFRAFRTHLRVAFQDYNGPYVSIDVLLTWATNRFGVIMVRHESRRAGQSNYTVMRLVSHAFNMMTGFSTLPLQVASFAGFAFMFFGFLLFVSVVVRYLLAPGVVPGFAFLACTVTILSGAQLFALGIIGEYLARMHYRIMQRPSYAVAEETN